MVLILVKTLTLPSHSSGDFDHGDIVKASGISYVTHTGNGTVEINNGRNGISRYFVFRGEKLVEA